MEDVYSLNYKNIDLKPKENGFNPNGNVLLFNYSSKFLGKQLTKLKRMSYTGLIQRPRSHL